MCRVHPAYLYPFSSRVSQRTCILLHTETVNDGVIDASRYGARKCLDYTRRWWWGICIIAGIGAGPAWGARWSPPFLVRWSIEPSTRRTEIHRASKEAYPFFRATPIKINHLWIQTHYRTLLSTSENLKGCNRVYITKTWKVQWIHKDYFIKKSQKLVSSRVQCMHPTNNRQCRDYINHWNWMNSYWVLEIGRLPCVVDSQPVM